MPRQFLAGLAVGAAVVFALNGLMSEPVSTTATPLTTPATSGEPAVSDAASAPDTTERHTESTPTTAPQMPVLANANESGIRVDVVANSMSITRRDATVRSVIDEIGRQSGIIFNNVASLRDDVIPIEVLDSSIDAGLRSVLAGYDVFFYYESATPNAPMQSVWVYPLRTGSALAPISPTDVVVAEVSADGVNNAEVDSLLADARAATDETQRLDALNRVLDAGVIPPRPFLEDVLQHDQSGIMRRTAFHSLLESPDVKGDDVRMLATMALSDPDDALRADAQQLVSDMNAAATHSSSDQEQQAISD